MIINGDSFQELKKLEDDSVDSIVTDPPYDIGFMNKKWDKKSLITNIEFWKECMRVLKPGGHLLAFGHSRTSHRMVTAVEDAGFEIRDTIMWMYGSGFPKSHNVAIAIDKKLGKKDQAKEWQGWGTALKPAYEPVVMARKPLEEKNVAENVMKWGTGGINIDECRVGNEQRFNQAAGNKAGGISLNMSADGMPEADGRACVGRFPANVLLDEEAGQLLDEQSGPTKASFVRNKTDGARPFNNEGEATNYTSEKINVEEDGRGASRYFHKVELEPIMMARKPLEEKNVAENVMKWGTGGINIDECRVETKGEDFSKVKGRPITKLTNNRTDEASLSGPEQQEALRKLQELGRFPANVILDSEAGQLLDEQSGITKGNGKPNITQAGIGGGVIGQYDGRKKMPEAKEGLQTVRNFGDSGGASRFFHKVEVEPIMMARKPLDEPTVAENVLKHGTGAINIEECRIGEEKIITNGKGNKFVENNPHGQRTGESVLGVNKENVGRFPANVILDSEAGEALDEQSGILKSGYVASHHKTKDSSWYGASGQYSQQSTQKNDLVGGASRFFHKVETEPQGRFPANVILDSEAGQLLDEQSGITKSSKRSEKYNKDTENRSGYTPAKSDYREDNTYSDSGGASRFFQKVETEPQGRFPANVILDEEAGQLLDEQAPKVGSLFSTKRKKDTTGGSGDSWTNGGNKAGEDNGFYDGLGGASRFFYCAKVATRERKLEEGKNNHPTVKPVKLMEYLVKLVTRKGGVVLDPFAGSGSTGVAAKNLGMKYILIEREAQYCDIIRARLKEK